MKEKTTNRFRKPVKIKRNRELCRVINGGRRNRYSCVSVYWMENDASFARCGILVSRKTGPSVYRNRVKRYVREWFRSFSEPLSNLDILIKIHAGSCTITRKTIEEIMLKWYQTEKK